MKYASTRLGEFEVPPASVLTFTQGLSGFELETEYAVLPFDVNTESPLHWLHSLTNPGLAFVVTNPFLFVPDYKVDLTAADKTELGIGANDTLAVLVIVRIPEDYRQMTANLIAPVVINEARRLCKQVILTHPDYDTRHYLLPESVRKN
ncbi:Flagellar assembly factor fliW [Nitrospina gracilis 3/211]|uniref:Flagellar assembly factor FliW n=1 Tax=Nitrospina gracilis (strain 3/211) TaxID=1266370 RepID=M1Z129_NITG3|nr:MULTISPECIES: flagellar assembly protein FliW [Nitrospina]MCF8722430.1 flagellar assembly factor FliW [Nitrospina sp. Nb-3]CCQ91214.1 Flagellar assembly factor fliW [Nitrospina gracilis 3/211]